MTTSLSTGSFYLKSMKQIGDILHFLASLTSCLKEFSFCCLILHLLKENSQQYLSESVYLTKSCIDMTKIHRSANLHPGYKTFAPPSELEQIWVICSGCNFFLKNTVHMAKIQPRSKWVQKKKKTKLGAHEHGF